jgi:outer membrane protein assembly factor BamE (lipoprotein component of BamABCDE complex)
MRVTPGYTGLLTSLTLLALLALSAGCKSSPGHRVEDRVWTEGELKGLQGKTRDEVQDLLGEPKGLYTYDSKGRWHYPRVLLQGEGERESAPVSVTVYFSQFGEHRVTIVDIVPAASPP